MPAPPGPLPLRLHGIERARWTHDRFVQARDLAGLPWDRVSAVLEDRFGTLWLGIQDDGLIRVREGHVWRRSSKIVGVFSAANATAMPQLFRMNKQGTRLFVTLNGAGKVAMFNIARPDRPELMSVVELGPGSGPHYVQLASADKRLVVTDYFLVEDLAPGGVVQVDGDHKIHVINVHGNRLELDTRFDLDFNRDIATGPARPHGVAIFPPRDQ